MSSRATRLGRPAFKAAYAAVLLGTPLIFWPRTGAWFLALGHWWLCILLRAFAVSFLAVPGAIWLSRRTGAMDVPNKRKLHSAPMPRLGGAAVLLGVLAATGRYFGASQPLALLAGGGAAVFLLSVADDFRPLPASLRLSVQAAVCLALILGGIRLELVPGRFAFAYAANGALTAFWVIGILNAVNFLDGIDGLAGSLGVLCSGLFLAVGWETRQSYLAVLTAALAGACLGFLPYNWRPAAVFLGDGGATLIGFLLAGVAVWGSWSQGNPLLSFSTPLLILAIPVFDMIYTTVSRIKNDQVHNVKEWLEFTGKDHLHHRLLRLGMTQVEAVVFVCSLNLILGLGALVIRTTGSPAGAWLLVVQSVLIFLIITVLMLLAREKTP